MMSYVLLYQCVQLGFELNKILYLLYYVLYIYFLIFYLYSNVKLINILFMNFSMTIEHNPQGPSTQLKLKSVKVSDEEIYMCESTYLEPLETCETSGSYSILLKVNGKYIKFCNYLCIFFCTLFILSKLFTFD